MAEGRAMCVFDARIGFNSFTRAESSLVQPSAVTGCGRKTRRSEGESVAIR
jgi:hypothetical protein